MSFSHLVIRIPYESFPLRKTKGKPKTKPKTKEREIVLRAVVTDAGTCRVDGNEVHKV